nr:leucine-rich repeat domain-containing protein [Lachnospiraceae bacterium]
MAAKKNTTKKKKSRRYLSRAARRTIAALLMVSALIVAAIPATPSRAAEGENEESSGNAGDPVTIKTGNLELSCVETSTSDCVELSSIKKINEAAVTDTIDISGPLPAENGLEYKITVIQSGIFSSPKSQLVFEDVTNFTANDVVTIQSGAFEGCPKLSMFKGTSVKEVQGNAFRNCAKLDTCTLNQGAEGVNVISDSAFENSGLKSMPVTPSISYIGNYAFKNSEIDGNINVAGPADVSAWTTVALGDGVFQDCSNIDYVTITGAYDSIGAYTFDGCSDLTNVVFPDTLTSIGPNSFDRCKKLMFINIPSGVAALQPNLFSSCDGLQKITLKNGPEFKAGETYDTDIADALPSNPNSSFFVEGYRIIDQPGGEDYTLAYKYCLSKGIKYVCIDYDGGVASDYFDVNNYGVLVNCDAKEYINNKQGGSPNTIVVPDVIDGQEITAIGSKAFDGVNGSGEVITSVILTSKISEIYSGAFANMKDLQSVVMTDNETTIVKDGAFPTRPDFFIFGVMKTATTSDGPNAYDYAMNNNIEFRASGKYDGGSDEVILIVEKGDNRKLSAIAENGEMNGNAIYEFPKIPAVRIPSGIEEISDKLFWNDKVLTSFAADSDEGVDGKTHGLKKLTDKQFEGCSELKNVSLPSTLYDVGALPFKNCQNLTTIDVDQNSPYCASESGVLYAPSTKDPQTSSVTSIADDPGPDKNFRIVEMLEYSDTTAYTIPASIKGKIIDEISDGAFSNNRNLTRFSTTGSGVTIIPKDCFNGAYSLSRITLAEEVGEVKTGAFQNLKSNNAGSEQPLFIINNNMLTYESKSGCFDYEAIKNSDIPYYFKSPAKKDTTTVLCGLQEDPSDTKDNLYWVGLVSEEVETKIPLSVCSIVYNGGNTRKYTGQTIPWEAGSPTSGDFYVVYNGTTILTYGKDYTITAPSNPVKAGTYQFTLTGTGEYEGTLTGEFIIDDGSSPGPTPTPTPGYGDFVVDYNYTGPGFFKWTGNRITPHPVVRSSENYDIILDEGIDYTLTYGDGSHDNKSMGVNIGLITINGLGNYAGKSGTSYFSIKKSVSENITGNPTPPGKTIDLTISGGVYDSSNNVSANIVLVDRTTGKTLQEGVDYAVTCTKISKKKQAIATITGMGDYYFDTYTSSRFAIKKKSSGSSSSSSSSSSSGSSSSSSSSGS